MKRILALLLVFAMLPVMALPVFAAEDAADGDLAAVNETLNEGTKEENGSILVPVRKLCEGLGATVEWNFSTEVATITYMKNTLKIQEGAQTANLNGEDVPITVPIRKYDGKLYGPVRFIAEGLGFGVEWDAESGDVTINDGRGSADVNTPYTVVGVTASEDDGNKPENVLDRDYNTRWSAESNGAYITLELDDVHPVAYVGIACYNGEERQSTVSVQVSTDGKTFKEVVTRWVSSITLDMEPIDLGGVYDAKYVRVLGYGNTANVWNSYTELSVYGPYADGTQPVATDGPAASNLGGEMTAEQQAALAKFDTLFDRLDVWYAHLYCEDCGGFVMTMSGHDDPNMECALEMTTFALSGIKSYTDAWSTMPDDIRQRFIDYIVERQDPVTGMFIDKQGPVNDRETARNQATGISWANTFKIDLPYVHPSQAASAGNSTDSTNTAVMPDYMATVDTYMAWVKAWNWDTNSWTAGDQTQQSLNYLNLLDDEKYEVYKAALMEFLEERQFDNGYWSPYLDFNAVSGAFKVGLIYSGLKERIPNADKVMETTIYCMENIYPTVAHYVRNPLSLLSQIAAYNTEYSERIKQAITDNIDTFIAWFDQFLAPDGGFAQYHGKSMSNFGGIYSSHQLWEGDVDSTLMILTARKAIYNLMGQKAPLLDFDDNFWKWISGEEELPLLYEEDYLNNPTAGGSEKEMTIDFQNMEPGTKLTGSEFGGSAYGGNSAKILLDRDIRDGRVLEVTYDGTLSAGPTFTVNATGGEDITDVSKIRYLPGLGSTDTVVEFDLKVAGETATSNNFFIQLGDGYALNFQGNNVLKIGTRIDSTNVAYGGNFTSIQANDWYHFRVEIHQGVTVDEYQAKVYIDGELAGINQNYLNKLTGSPASPYGGIKITWYRAGKGAVYLDNIRMYQKS